MASASITHVDSLATTQQLLAHNDYREGLIIVNTDANDLYIKYGITATAAADGWTYKISPGATWEMPTLSGYLYKGRIDGIWSVDGAGYAEITELK